MGLRDIRLDDLEHLRRELSYNLNRELEQRLREAQRELAHREAKALFSAPPASGRTALLTPEDHRRKMEEQLTAQLEAQERADRHAFATERAKVAERERVVEFERAQRRHRFAAFEHRQREATISMELSAASLAEVRAEWSRQLREKVAASSAAATERDRLQVVVDLDW